jgi:hypothetical protein
MPEQSLRLTKEHFSQHNHLHCFLMLYKQHWMDAYCCNFCMTHFANLCVGAFCQFISVLTGISTSRWSKLSLHFSVWTASGSLNKEHMQNAQLATDQWRNASPSFSQSSCSSQLTLISGSGTHEPRWPPGLAMPPTSPRRYLSASWSQNQPTSRGSRCEFATP